MNDLLSRGATSVARQGDPATGSEGKPIPKLLHQTFPTKVLPSEIQRNVDEIRRLNPGWEYRLYDDDDVVDFIKANYGSQVLERYFRINPEYGAARADLFRYLLVFKCGGVYLDIKSTLTRALDDSLLPEDQYLLSRWANGPGAQFEGWGLHPELRDIAGGEIQQWHIVAVPGHPFLRAVIATVLRNIDRYNPGLHHVGQTGVLRLTGPIAYTKAIAPILHLHPHRIVDSHSDLGFEYSIYGAIGRRAHKAIFNHHYSDLQSPVVTVGAVKTAFGVACIFLRKVRRRLRIRR